MHTQRETSATITLLVDGCRVTVLAMTTVIGAISQCDAHGAVATTRRSVLGQARAAYCGMGVCHECRVTIDGVAHVLACQTLCRSGMDVRTGALGSGLTASATGLCS
jgi:hypothetical protein